MIRLSRGTILIPKARAFSNLSYSSYLSDLGGELKTKTTELSQKQLQLFVETGTSQAIKALSTIEKQMNEMSAGPVSTSVTFNAGILQITFSTTREKSTVRKQ